MPLPNPSLSFSPFAILTAEEMNNLVENIESLAAGTGLNDASVTSSKLNYSSFVVNEYAFTPTGTGDWRNTLTIDLSSYPNGSKLEIYVSAYSNPLALATLGIRLSDSTSKSSLGVTNGEFISLAINRIITKSNTTLSIQLLGDWSNSSSGWYSVKRVG